MAIIYLAGGSAALLLLTGITAIAELIPDKAWEKLLGRRKWDET